MAVSKYDITLDGVGYNIVRDPKSGRQSYSKREAPFSVQKIANGDPNYRDLTFWQRWASVDFKNGAKQDIFNDPSKFWKSAGIDPTVHEQITLERALASIGNIGSAVNTLLAWRTSQNWWNINYGYRQQLTITNNTSNDYPSGFPALISIDTGALQTASKLRSDRNDWQVLYFNGSSWVQLKRDYIDSTHTFFALQANIAHGQSDSNYYIYYGYATEVAGQNQQPSAEADWNAVYGMYGTTPDANSVLVAHFREGSGASVNDDSSNTNNGTYTNPSWGTNGNLGRYGVFDGHTSNRYVNFGSGSDLDIGSFTVEGWITPTGSQPPNEGEIAVKLRSGSTSRSFSVQINNSGVLAASNGSDTDVAGSTVLANSTAYHFAATFDGTTAKVFINGVQEGSQSWPSGVIDSTGKALTVAERAGQDGISGLVAQLQHVRVSNVARSSFPYAAISQITTTSEGEITTQPPAQQFQLFAGCANGKIYLWDGISTWTSQYDANAPTVTFSGGGGSGATGTATVVNGVITAINITNGGSGYSSNPSVSVSGTPGTGATFSSGITGGVVTSVAVTNGGSGYLTTVNCSLVSSVGGTLKAYFGTGSISDITNGDARLISYDGTNWTVAHTFNTTTESNIFSIAEYSGAIYVGIGPQAKIYTTSDASTWSLSKQIRVPQNPGYIYSLVEYNGRLYAGGGSPEFLNTKYYNGFLWAFDGSLWYNIYDFDFTVIKTMAVYDSNLFIGTYHGQLYVYNTASMDKLWDFGEKYGYAVQIVSSVVYNDKFHFGLAPQGNKTGNEAVYVFDRAGIHQAYQNTNVANYNCFIQANNFLMIGTDTGEVDKVDTSNYVASGWLQSSYFDANLPTVDKVWDDIQALHDPLVAGQTLTFDYRYQDSDSWTNIGSNSTIGSNITILTLPVGLLSKKISFRITIAGTNTTVTPRVINVILKYSVAQDIKKLWTMRLLCVDNIFYPDRTYQFTSLTVASLLGDTTLTVGDTSQFPSSGIVQLGINGPLITYTGKTSTTFTGCSGVTAQAIGTQVATTGRSRSQQLWNSRKGKKVVTFVDVDAVSYSVWFSEVAEDGFVINASKGIESEMSVSFVEL